MIDHLIDYYNQYAEFTKSNQFLGAAVAASSIGAITFFARAVPRKIIGWIRNLFVVSVRIDYDNDWGNRTVYVNVGKYLNSKRSRFSKNFALKHDESESNTIIPGVGSHIFLQGRRLFWFRVDKEPIGGASSVIKESTKISTFGISSKPITDLIHSILPIKDDENKISTFTSQGSSWMKRKVNKRSLDSVIVDDVIGKRIIESIDNFLKSKAWYDKHGVSYKHSIFLHGSPGTGKTSIIKALSSHYNRPLYIINMAMVNDYNIDELFHAIPPKSMVVMEDIDCVNNVNVSSRSGGRRGETTIEDVLYSKQSDGSTVLSLSSILNVLDGIKPLDDIVIFMTTNLIDKIDPAILRKGRTDDIIEIRALTTDGVNKYLKYSFGDDAGIDFDISIKGCDLQAVIIDNKQDVNAVKRELLEKYRK